MALPQPPPDYGLDAPPVVFLQFLISGACVVLAALLYGFGVPHPLGIPLCEIGVLVGANCLLTASLMVWYSRSGKVRQRERLLDLVPWRGDETVLDVGCGRGLLLVGAARRLTAGKVVGVDVWRQEDLGDNRPEAALENARREGVAERVEIKDGDARHLPFADASFDVVLSSLVLHNISAAADRGQAVREIARVLKPGGHVALMDINYTRDYVRILDGCGVGELRRSAAGAVFTPLFTALTFGAVRFYRVTGRKRRCDESAPSC